MKALLIALTLAATVQGWAVSYYDEDHVIIVNSLDYGITCYAEYAADDVDDDDWYIKLRVSARSNSRPFPRKRLYQVDCF